MKRILVTGGTGVLGRQIVRRLDCARVLSRRGGSLEGAEVVRGDLETGEGLGEAVDGVDVIVHAATSGTDLRRPDRDVTAARRLLEAVRGEPHIVYVSIVGVDTIPYGYFRTKLAVERLIERSGLPSTTLRATQFHDLVIDALAFLTKGPVAIVPRDMSVQSVDAGDVAERMVELALGDPAGRVADMGGPRVERVEDLTRAFLDATHRRRPLVRVPIPGRSAAGFRAGRHLAPEGATGVRSFAEALRDRVTPTGTIKPQRDLRRVDSPGRR